MGHEEPFTRKEMRTGLAEELADIASERLRQRPVFDAPHNRVVHKRVGGKRRRLINWASNDYLGARHLIKQKNAARRSVRTWGTGSGAARLLAGGLALHQQFEQRAAHYFGFESALLCTTGYQANIAALVALMSDPEDVVVLDRLAHASMYDGSKLSAGSMIRFKHNDIDDLKKQLKRTMGARRRLVCVEGIYSMDGDEAKLKEIAACCDEFGALLYVDEAHSIGVLGPGGRGLCADLDIKPDILIGTNSKSLGSQGGYILGSTSAIELIVNRGRSFIYSTAPVPAAIGAAIESLNMLRDEPELGANLQQRSQDLRSALREQGWQTVEGRSPIVPIIIGDEERCLQLSEALAEAGHYVPAIRPPTVPPQSSRLRLSLSLAHKSSDMSKLIKVLAELANKFVT